MENTSFNTIYDRFLGKITDDMYMEWTEAETKADELNILLDSIPNFEFPRFKLYDYNITSSCYNLELTEEEIDILAHLMLITWLGRLIDSVENIRMKYSGSDFKMTSQANHLVKLIELRNDARLTNKRKQRLYKRRKTEDGSIKSNLSSIMSKSVFDGN